MTYEYKLDCPATLVKQYEVTDECIERIAETVVRKLSERKWIPASERLPEVGSPVLVWLYEDYYLSCLHRIDDTLCWDFDEFSLEGEDFYDVVAWMPLPEPYKEDKHE